MHTAEETTICIIGVYFGKFPEWFELWLVSAAYNSTIDFLIVTDQNISVPAPNIKIIKSDLASFKTLAEQKLSMKIYLDHPYKLCDFKEVYGVILEDEIQSYDYWGECDFDIVWGDLRAFFDKYNLEKYDKFLNRGHLTLYRNAKEVNNRYRLKGGQYGNYREVFKSERNWGFDETTGINRIYEKNGLEYFDKFICADIDMKYKDFRIVERPGYKFNHEYQVPVWEQGKVYLEYFENGTISRDEYAYIHLQKRYMPKQCWKWDEVKAFYITSGGFVEKTDKTSLATIRKLNSRKELNREKESRSNKNAEKWSKINSTWIGRRYWKLRENAIHFTAIIIKKVPMGRKVISRLKR